MCAAGAHHAHRNWLRDGLDKFRSYFRRWRGVALVTSSQAPLCHSKGQRDSPSAPPASQNARPQRGPGALPTHCSRGAVIAALHERCLMHQPGICQG